MKQTVIAIIGPTAVGKTNLSLEVAKQFDGEIISGDSMQVYKGMDIGTAKVTKEEMAGVPHHMIDIKEPWESFSVAEFQTRVKQHIENITARGKLPILVGGSGLYVQAALYDYNFADNKRNITVTRQLVQQMEEEGAAALYSRLKALDPIQAEKTHPNNARRVIRALEIYETTGITMTEWQKSQQLTSPYNVQLIGLEMDREILYNRINQRVDKMINQGLVEEVQSFYEKGYADKPAMQGIGYKELIPYFKHQRSIEESIDTLKQNSRRFAKRQYTWFRNKMEVNWYSLTPENASEKSRLILRDIAGFLKQK
ncbi:tRNA (adenosine(37)-N6)-dimethylallyltransferase MiaA [Oceanobacillus manasiensis]|uniref:tRNA (adenosine(37)-N6)-dimethylallyltransferase MiaA n=1 Tax=Oceanobacillus manasiensis TaxID=586413 RepID=UPI0005A6B0B8|nr:tRNA (adenosine(37)-N6)-dimethylallyltransferase MiaA [Oceanobacillus manasiensis]